MKPHRGTMILVLGILGLLVCPFIGIAAWTMGKQDIVEMDGGVMDPEGRQLTQIGKILGIIAVVLLVVQIVVFAAILVLGGGAAMMQPQ